MAAQSGWKFSEWWRVGGKLRYFGQLYFSFGSVVLKAAAASRKAFWGLKAYGQLSGVGSTWLTPAAQQSGGTEPPAPHSSDCPPTPFTNGFSWKANHQANKIQTFPGTVMMKQLVGWFSFNSKPCQPCSFAQIYTSCQTFYVVMMTKPLGCHLNSVPKLQI